MDKYIIWRRRILSRIVNKKVDLSDISLISMNCIGGILYHDCGNKFLSPTIDLFFTPDDFVKFVNNLKYYLSIKPTVIMGEKYPIGIIDDIKIFFVHYNSEANALEKWEKRKKRINPDKIFIIMVDRDGFTNDNFDAFIKIKYPKILFTNKREYMCSESLYLSKYKNLQQLPDIIPGRHMYDKMKIVNLINRAYKNG